MPQQYDETSQVHEAQEVVGFVLVACRDASEAQQPCEEAFDFPSTLVAAQLSTVGPAPAPFSFLGSDQLDVLLRELCFERRTVVGFVADASFRFFAREATLDGGIDETYFVTLTCSDGGRYWKTRTVCDRHDLGGKPAPSFSHQEAPLFAPACVPSMNVSLRSSFPRSTRSSANACSTRCRTPSFTQLWKRRKHVAYGGYRRGMSAHGAPVRRIHNTPLNTSRGSRHGRPRPSSRTSGTGSNCSTAAHCSSVRSISTLDHKVDPQSIAARFHLNLAALHHSIYEMRSSCRASNRSRVASL